MGKVPKAAQPRLRALSVLDVKIHSYDVEKAANFNSETAEHTEGKLCRPYQLTRR